MTRRAVFAALAGAPFLAYLRATFPQLRRLSQLRRDPHLLGWFRWLSEQPPLLSNPTRRNQLTQLRRLLNDLAANGHPAQPDLIRRQDFPPQPRYLPRPLSLQEDQLLQQELRRTDDLAANALLLTRATGIRIGECLDLPLDCLRQVGTEQWALHVPLGKLHTERLVPADTEVRRIVERILTLRRSVPAARFDSSPGFLLPRRGGMRYALMKTLRSALDQAAKRTGCFTHVTPHRLRPSFATEMLRLGVSLPALMQLLGHKGIHMSLRYVQVTQQDLQREFHQARQNAAHPHRLPTLALPQEIPSAGLPGVRQALEATRHLLEMYRRQLGNEKTRRKCSASTNASSLLLHNYRGSMRRKMRKDWPINYNKRGTAEQWIKKGKQAVKMTRLSCHRLRSNEVRLCLTVIAYNLGNLWRRLVRPKRIDGWSLTSLQQRLVKTGGRLIKHARYYWAAAGREPSDAATV